MLDPNKFIEEFKIELEKTTNQPFLIEKEIKRIDSILYHSSKEDYIDLLNWNVPEQLGFDSFFDKTVNERTEIKCNYIRYIFFEYQKTGIYDYTETKASEIQGFTESDEGLLKASNERQKREIEIIKKYADYYSWLKNIEKEYLTKPNTKKSTLTLKQKLLALHYLGLDLNQTDNINTAKLLSQILGAGSENIRKSLSYVSNGKNNVRTDSNLNKVSELFENHSLIKISNKIKKEI